MKNGPLGPMPWDLVVFLTITTVGFGFSVQKVVSPRSHSFVRLADDGERGPAATLSSQTLDLGCVEQKLNHDRVTSEEGSIRIKGNFCSLSANQMKSFDGVRVRNVTNGTEGTIFFKGYENAFVTDYLVLSSGRNVIQVEWKETANSLPKTLVTEVYEK